MNSLVISGIGIFLFLIAYKFYAGYLERLWGVNPDEKTPAYKNRDGVDYIPVKHWSILFGHHFASIAGAGPIIGPVIAGVIWGWGPAVLWIVFGSILLGGVHDFSALMVSIRHNGKSIGDVSSSVIGRRAKIIFSIFLWFTLVLIVAVFAAVTAKTFIGEPKIVIPTFSLIIIAIFFGILVYRLNFPQIYATIISLILYVLLFIIGSKFSVVINSKDAMKIWIIILLSYSFIASVMPVNLLLQPRDYLSSFILFFGLLFGYIGLIITHPQIHAPAFISFSSSKGPLWPMMFVIIACGAISGFHSLVSSGTTSKQLPNEKYAKRIGYGGMLMESALAVMALLAVSAGLLWKGPNLNFVYPYLMKTKGWIYTFGAGYMRITKPLLGSIGLIAGVTMLNAFILTTLDSATRIARYIGVELFGEGFGIPIFRNIYFNTLVIILIALLLSLGAWKSIWPVFGASNQLIASLSLFIGSLWLMNKGKKYKIALIPGYFMFITTLGALIYQAFLFFHQRNYLLEIVSLILIILAIFLIFEMIKSQQRRE